MSLTLTWSVSEGPYTCQIHVGASDADRYYFGGGSCCARKRNEQNISYDREVVETEKAESMPPMYWHFIL